MEQASARPSGAETPRESADRFFTIGDMARHYQVTLRALRFYEDRELIKPVRYGVSRFYDAAARARLETILRGKKLGFTLAQIYTMLSKEHGAADAPRLEMKETQILAQIGQLERRREELEAAIVELRDTHRQMTDGQMTDGQATGSTAQAASAA